MEIIDAHHHFWRYTPKEYPWIGDAMRSVRRDFLPAELERDMRTASIAGVVSVQARQTLKETRWLLELAQEHKFIRGVVGWVPLTEPGVAGILEELQAASAGLRGVRHVLQDETDDRFMLREDFNRGVSTLLRLDLAYDILILERHLPYAIEFVDRHPNQRFVLDHLAKPRIQEGSMEPWRTLIRELARRPHVCCKVSGIVTEADLVSWTEAQLRPYFDVVLEAFGPSRLMFGSDWPVCLTACDYPRWLTLVQSWIQPLSAGERGRILGETAVEAYRL